MTMYTVRAVDIVRFAWTPHGTYRDLELFVRYLDYTPTEALLCATSMGGALMMHEHELGRIQPGFYADMILVNGNPLEDIRVLSGPDHIEMVMINGRVHREHPKDREEWINAGDSLVKEAKQLKLAETEAEAKAV